MRILYQLIGNDIKELWYFPIEVSESDIREAYRNYKQSDYDSFEDYIDEYNPQLDGERVFVEEVYV